MEIVFENITKWFDDTLAVDDVSLRIKSGEYISILGPSGCGKTTLLRMVAGLIQPTSGTIYFNQQDVSHLPPDQRNIGYVFQIRGDLKKAEKVFRKAAELYGELGFKEGEASAYGSIGNIYLTRGDLKKTEAMWNNSVQIMRDIEKERMIKTLGSWVDSI